jgi:hypothetical protein
VCCWAYGEAGGWEVVGRSPLFEARIQKVALNVKLGPRLDTVVAVAMDSKIRLWEFCGGATPPNMQQQLLQLVPRPASPPHSAPQPAPAAPLSDAFDLTVPIDDLFFIGNQLIATSKTGKIGVRNAVTRAWQRQDVKPILCHDRAASLLILGCADGSIYSVDLEKFPLRMKDNDLLVNHLHADPDSEGISALSVYSTASAGADKCLEIAYGTDKGKVRVVIQVCVRFD